MSLKDKFCSRPWNFFEIHEEEVFNCCPSWVSMSLGETSTDLNIEKVWNGKKSVEFRKSILDGSFKYCNKELCPLIKNKTLPSKEEVRRGEHGETLAKVVEHDLHYADVPETISLCYDRSCNLRCPSCRKNFIYYNEKLFPEKYTKLSKINDALLEYIHSSKKPVKINITGSGDPFGSKNFYELIKKFDYNKNPNLKIVLQTNGVLFDENRWESIKNIHKLHIDTIISLDAGTEEAYKLTRVGGDWHKVNENLKFIKKLQDKNLIKWVRLDMVVQNNNYKTIPQFIEIAKKHDFYSYTSRIVNWGTFTETEYNFHNVFDENHVNNTSLIEVINNVPNYSKHDWGNLTNLKNNE